MALSSGTPISQLQRQTYIQMENKVKSSPSTKIWSLGNAHKAKEFLIFQRVTTGNTSYQAPHHLAQIGLHPTHCPKANSFEHPNPNSRGKIRIYAIHIAPITY